MTNSSYVFNKPNTYFMGEVLNKREQLCGIYGGPVVWVKTAVWDRKCSGCVGKVKCVHIDLGKDRRLK